MSIFIGSILGILSFSSIGLSGHLSDGYRQYLRIKVDNELFGFTEGELSARSVLSGKYPKPDRSTIDKSTTLTSFDGLSNKMVYVMGDSHTIQYLNAIDSHYKINENSIRNGALINASAKFPPVPSDFPEAFDARVETIVISYFWAYRFGSRSVNQAVRCCGAGGQVGDQATHYAEMEEVGNYEVIIDQFIKSLLGAGKHVIIILDNPFGEELDPTNFIQFAGRNLVNFIPPIGAPREVFENKRREINQRLIRISRENGIDYIDPFDFFCSSTWCPAVTPDSHFIYKDYDHFSPYASENLINFVDRFIE